MVYALQSSDFAGIGEMWAHWTPLQRKLWGRGVADRYVFGKKLYA